MPFGWAGCRYAPGFKNAEFTHRHLDQDSEMHGEDYLQRVTQQIFSRGEDGVFRDRRYATQADP